MPDSDSRDPAVPLHVHSVYSLGRGTATPAALAEQAARYGHRALALTDRNALYGAIPFVEACRDWGVRPILGAEIDGPDGSAVLLVRDATGYAHLCRLLTLRHLDPAFTVADGLAAWGEGLHVLVDEPALLARLADRLPRGSLWGELRAAGTTAARHAAVRGAARGAGAGVVATGPVSGLTRADHALHVTLSAVRENTLVSRLRPGDLAHPDAVFKAPAALRSRFREHPDALAHTHRIAADCRFVPARDRWILPSLCLAPGTDALEHLRGLCLAGMDRRYGRRPRPARLRLERELGVIARLGFVDYFVIVGDIVGFARSRGIATVGRGSGAGALTAYLLGITNVDPLRYGLFFERFLHEKRPDCPDLDIDLCWKRRDEVIEHVYRTYGRERTAMISTHTTYRVRSAFREAARAHGVPARAVDRLSRLLPGRAESLAEAFRGSPRAAREIPRDEAPWPAVLRHAEGMLGFPRHLGVHPGGIVIADRPIDHYVPLEEATKGIVVTQYEMRAIETVGLVKIDLLGNRALSTIQETLELVEERTGERPDPDAFPDPDPATARLLSAGDTLGVFQMESPGMRNLNRMLRTDDLATTIAAVALIRPGPAGSGMKERYVRRRRGLEEAVPPHPRLAGVLDDTHGIPLYEEDVMRMAAAAAGVTMEDGDMIRRAIVEARPEQRDEIGRVFRRACERRGFRPDEAGEVWQQLLRFGGFAFCKAHAAGYGVLAYRAGFLKAHHPVEFTAALLNHHAGMYDTRTHAEDARRRGVELRLPHVNRSAVEVVPEGNAVRLGLGMLRGVGDACRERLLAAREHGPFRGVEDLLLRAAPARPEAEALVLGGALDGLGRTRPEALCVLDTRFEAFAARRRRGAHADLFGSLAPEPAAVPPLPEFGPAERLWLEWHVLGVCVGDHPMRLFRAGGAAGDAVPAAEAERAGGRRLRVAGVVAARRTVPTRGGEPMQFVTLEDETGMMECTLFPAVYRRHRGAVRTLGPYVAEGRVEDQYGAPTLTVERIHAVPVPDALAAAERRLRAAAR